MMTRGEQNILDDANEFIRQASNRMAATPSTGLLDVPEVTRTESNTVSRRFGLTIQPTLQGSDPGAE